MTVNWLKQTTNSLSQKDENWQIFLSGLDSQSTNYFWDTLYKLHSYVEDKPEDLLDTVDRSDLFLRKHMVHVQQSELELRRIAPEWDFMVSDPDLMDELWSTSQTRLNAFMEKNHFSHLRFYGGVKDLGALRGKLTASQELMKDSKIRPFMDDIWDMVRCRIIVDKSEDMREICQLLWEDFFEDIIRCRNYYYSPKGGREISPYRAVHYIIADGYGHIFELQVQHRFREAISMLDHPYIFKKDDILEFENEDQKKWMLDMGHAATILEAEELSGE